MANLIFEHLKKVYPNGFVSVDDQTLFVTDINHDVLENTCL